MQLAISSAPDVFDVSTAARSQAPLRPGYLLAPFGWAAAPLLEMISADPVLLREALQFDHRRMHLIAFAFAHLQGSWSPQTVDPMVRGSLDEVVQSVLGRRPVGLRRALDRLPVSVMPPESYRRLVVLLEDLGAAKLIHHANVLNEYFIGLFYDVPAPLRLVVARASADFFIRADGFSNGLRV